MRHSSSTTFQNHTVGIGGILPKRLLRCWPAGSSAPDTRQRHTHLPRRGYVTRTCRHNFSIPRVDRHAVTHTHPYQIRARARSQAHACLEHNCAYLYEGVDSRLAVPVPGPVTGLLLLWESRRRGASRHVARVRNGTALGLSAEDALRQALRTPPNKSRHSAARSTAPDELLHLVRCESGATASGLQGVVMVSSRCRHGFVKVSSWFRQGVVMVSSRFRHRFRSRLPLRIRAEPR